MNLYQQSDALTLISILWAMLAVACLVFFTRSDNAPLKRQLWPYYNVLLAGFVVAVAIIMRFPWSWIVALVPLAILIAFMNFRATRFCMSCSTTLRRQGFLRRSDRCARCGASFVWHTSGRSPDPRHRSERAPSASRLTWHTNWPKIRASLLQRSLGPGRRATMKRSRFLTQLAAAPLMAAAPVATVSAQEQTQTKRPLRIMMKSAWGSDDPTKAAFAFLHGLALARAGHEVQIFLLGEAVSLMRKSVASAVVPVGWQPLSATLAEVADRKIPIFACGACSRARGVTEADLASWGASFGSPEIFVGLVEWADRVIAE
jgi:predicted peroxiredoxin